jgi:predicted nucleotidyltransferase
VRVVAAFLGGSRVAGTVDEYSDLDLYLIVRDEDYDAFFARL